MIYIINDQLLMQKGQVNAIIYNPEKKKILHIKNALADRILTEQSLPERAIEFIGKEKIEVQTSDCFLKVHPLTPQVDSIFVDLTNACNLKCKGCYSYREKKKYNISPDNLDKVSDISCAPYTKLVLLGGEPLLFPKTKLIDYLKAWSEKFHRVIIFTNGTYFNENLAEHFAAQNISVRFTLYSFDELKHDDYVSHTGAFDSVMTAISRAKKFNVDYKINFILDGHEYIKSSNHIQELGLDSSNVFIDLIRPTDIYSVEDYIKIKKQNGELIRPIRYKSFFQALRDTQYHSCYCGKVAVSVDGQISQCPWEKNSTTGSIDKYNSQFVENSWRMPIQKAYRYCSVCEFSFLCFDCTNLNGHLSTENLRPVSCRYNPTIGSLEC